MLKQEKKLYFDPVLEIAAFKCADVITASEFGDNDIDWNEWSTEP